ncbi:hypothetical protein O5161_26745 [Escherichia coli]|nr:hypothetical protein [Escherichia coli]
MCIHTITAGLARNHLLIIVLLLLLLTLVLAGLVRMASYDVKIKIM